MSSTRKGPTVPDGDRGSQRWKGSHPRTRAESSRVPLATDTHPPTSTGIGYQALAIQGLVLSLTPNGSYSRNERRRNLLLPTPVRLIKVLSYSLRPEQVVPSGSTPYYG